MKDKIKVIKKMKSKIPFTEYAVYSQSGEFLDVISLTKKQAKEYIKNNPDEVLEELDDVEI